MKIGLISTNKLQETTKKHRFQCKIKKLHQITRTRETFFYTFENFNCFPNEIKKFATNTFCSQKLTRTFICHRSTPASPSKSREPQCTCMTAEQFAKLRSQTDLRIRGENHLTSHRKRKSTFISTEPSLFSTVCLEWQVHLVS